MTVTAATTRIEGINIVLRAAGLRPVNSESAPDALLAGQELDAASRAIQGEGWECNTEEKISLSPNAGNEIVLGEDVLWVDPTDQYSAIVTREGKLFNKQDQSFKMTGDVEVDLIRMLPLEDLTEDIRMYIIRTAAYAFVATKVSNKTLIEKARQDLALARGELMREDALREDANMLTDNMDLYRTVGRRRFNRPMGAH